MLCALTLVTSRCQLQKSTMIKFWLLCGGALIVIILAMLFVGWWFDDGTDDYDEPDQR